MKEREKMGQAAAAQQQAPVAKAEKMRVRLRDRHEQQNESPRRLVRMSSKKEEEERIVPRKQVQVRIKDAPTNRPTLQPHIQPTGEDSESSSLDEADPELAVDGEAAADLWNDLPQNFARARRQRMKYKDRALTDVQCAGLVEALSSSLENSKEDVTWAGYGTVLNHFVQFDSIQKNQMYRTSPLAWKFLFYMQFLRDRVPERSH